MLDLPDYIATRGYILLFGGEQEMYVEAYRRLVEERVLDLATNHPTMQAIEQGRKVSDQQLLALERTLRHELGVPGIELTEGNIRKAFAKRVGSLIEFVRDMLELDGIPDYQEIVRRQFDAYMGGRHLRLRRQRLPARPRTAHLARHPQLGGSPAPTEAVCAGDERVVSANGVLGVFLEIRQRIRWGGKLVNSRP